MKSYQYQFLTKLNHFFINNTPTRDSLSFKLYNAQINIILEEINSYLINLDKLDSNETDWYIDNAQPNVFSLIYKPSERAKISIRIDGHTFNVGFN